MELARSAEPDPQEVLDHLAESIPGAAPHRGKFDRGPIRAVDLPGGFAARLRRGELELQPAGPLEDWLERLLGDLRRRAQSDQDLRTALTRRGWALS